MANYNDSLIDLVRKVTEARQIEYWVDQGGTVVTERSNIASVVGVSQDKTDDLLDMISVLEDDPHYALEELSSSSAVQGSKGKEYSSRIVYRFSAV